MNDLRGARVLIIDDSPEEALPIAKAFSKRGIATAFFDGAHEGLPIAAERLSGVRLAVLDMDLTGGGAQDKDKVATLARVLFAVLSPENGPYALLAWTKHKELIAEFETSLFGLTGIPRPILSMAMQKSDCKRGDDFDLQVIGSKLRKCLEMAAPLAVLEAWEGKAFESATRVTNSLSDISVGAGDDMRAWRERWNKELLQLMRALAGADAGENLGPKGCLYNVYNSLNPLHADGMDRYDQPIYPALKKQSELIFNAPPNCGAEKRAQLNTMLHISFESLRGLSSGNMYLFSNSTSRSWLPTVLQLLDDLAEGSGNKKKANITELAALVRRVAIEVSPLCDHAQKNIRLPRFVAGLLVPTDLDKKIKARADYLWRIGPLLLEGRTLQKGHYSLYASLRHLTTQKIGQVNSMKAFARIRSQALTDLQARLSRHAGRPAVMLLE